LLCGATVLALVSSACDRPPSVDLKEWSPADHDGEKKGGEGAANPKQGAKGDAGGTPALVEITWRNQCAACHGAQGKGDGPQGPMFKAPDLGRPDWQSRVNDDEIAATILNGKGRMPKFDLPPELVRGLVGRVRSFRGQ
jgi:cytochrome c oxidase cbb3-type subunit 3